ncbi:hypothetical protein AZKH_p0426 (plasmid) [Azoarcus sp. KH32C]|nr:hypothetical protein AZKH_p0426 [Azoarcus sp. KH32C]
MCWPPTNRPSPVSALTSGVSGNPIIPTSPMVIEFSPPIDLNESEMERETVMSDVDADANNGKRSMSGGRPA